MDLNITCGIRVLKLIGLDLNDHYDIWVAEITCFGIRVLILGWFNALGTLFVWKDLADWCGFCSEEMKELMWAVLKKWNGTVHSNV